MMLNLDQEMQEASAEQGNRLRKVLVESTSVIADVDRQSKTVENTQIQWWMLALPAGAFLFIGTVFFLNALFSPEDQVEKLQSNAPVLLQASSSSKSPVKKLSNQAFVSSIAYSQTNAIAFINDKMVSEGDVVDGFTVLKIHENAVEFEKEGNRWTQEIGEQKGSLQ